MYIGPWELALNGPVYIKTKLSFGLHYLQGPSRQGQGNCDPWEQIPLRRNPGGHYAELSASAFIICKGPAAGTGELRPLGANPPATKSRWGIKQSSQLRPSSSARAPRRALWDVQRSAATAQIPPRDQIPERASLQQNTASPGPDQY